MEHNYLHLVSNSKHGKYEINLASHRKSQTHVEPRLAWKVYAWTQWVPPLCEGIHFEGYNLTNLFLV